MQVAKALKSAKTAVKTGIFDWNCPCTTLGKSVTIGLANKGTGFAPTPVSQLEKIEFV